jgi:hypothetical protein
MKRNPSVPQLAVALDELVLGVRIVLLNAKLANCLLNIALPT